jgi:hypothetical protein
LGDGLAVAVDVLVFPADAAAPVDDVLTAAGQDERFRVEVLERVSAAGGAHGYASSVVPSPFDATVAQFSQP